MTLRVFTALTIIATAGCRSVEPPARQRLEGYTIASSYHDGLALVLDTKSRLYGCIDRDGRVAIKPQFGSAQPFSEGLAAVTPRRRAAEPHGYIGKDGEWVIRPRFDAAFPFSEGLAVVEIDGRQGFVVRAGELRIAARFDRAFAFSEGRARVVLDGMAGFIDASGARTAPPMYFKAGDYREGLAPVCTRDKCGFLNLAGETAIPLEFDDAGEFGGGIAPVRQDGAWGYIDRQGHWVVEPRFDEAHALREGLALVGEWMPRQPDKGYGAYTGAGLVYGYLNPKGEMAIPLAIRHASSFAGGLARIQVPSRGAFLCSDCYDTAYLRPDGRVVGHCRSGREFREGAAVVIADRMGQQRGFLIDPEGNRLIEFDGADLSDPLHWAERATRVLSGFIGKQGELALKPEYSSAEPFSEGLALVRMVNPKPSARLVFIDRGGKTRIELPRQASAAQSFSEGLALVTMHGVGARYAYIDRTGATRIEAPYAAAQPFSGGLAAVKTAPELGANNWGYIDGEGKMAIPPGFYQASPFVRGLAMIARVENTVLTGGAIDRTGRVVAPAFYPPDRHSDALAMIRLDGRLTGERKLIPIQTRSGFAYLDREGRVAIQNPRYGQGQEFSDGRAAVMLAGEDGRPRWGYIGEDGELVIPARYAEARPFIEGFAAVRDETGRYGYLNRDGGWAIPPGWFEQASDFQEGRALVKVNGRFGYLDGGGALAIPPRYLRASDFSEGLAAVGLARPVSR
ncbi:MAG: WG repeat-containing protein [Bryobacteraceae bacterium]|nr:WG repeat-containing protein [Bryobacteraceae bacterium]